MYIAGQIVLKFDENSKQDFAQGTIEGLPNASLSGWIPGTYKALARVPEGKEEEYGKLYQKRPGVLTYERVKEKRRFEFEATDGRGSIVDRMRTTKGPYQI